MSPERRRAPANTDPPNWAAKDAAKVAAAAANTNTTPPMTLGERQNEALRRQSKLRRAERQAASDRARILPALAAAGFVASGKDGPPADPVAATEYWRQVGTHVAAWTLAHERVRSRGEWLNERAREGRLTCGTCGQDLDPATDSQLTDTLGEIPEIARVLEAYGWKRARR